MCVRFRLFCTTNLPNGSILRNEVCDLIESDDIRWRQRVKVEWLKSGDRNTKYFHTCVTQRRKQNQILSIKDQGGRMWDDWENIGNVFINYFSKLFTLDNI